MFFFQERTTLQIEKTEQGTFETVEIKLKVSPSPSKKDSSVGDNGGDGEVCGNHNPFYRVDIVISF